tara:strand:- start:261 stop:365 length:105 start_codon:yes stop_codon:yes gene_type:complete
MTTAKSLNELRAFNANTSLPVLNIRNAVIIKRII